MSLSLFLYNWQFAGFALIRLLVIHNIKREDERLVSLQHELFAIPTAQLQQWCYLPIVLPFARYYFPYLNVHFAAKYFLGFRFFKDWRT